MATKKNEFTLADRFAHGAFTVREALALAHISRATFSRHRSQGLIKTVTRGKRVFVPGPALREYIGEPAIAAE